MLSHLTRTSMRRAVLTSRRTFSGMVPKGWMMASGRSSASRPSTTSSTTTTTNASFSTTNKDDLVKLDMEVETGIAVLTLNRPPANSLSLEMCQAISNAIKVAEDNYKVQALIMSSSLKKIFCAGLDLTELYQPDTTGRLPEFWNSFQQVYLDLYSSRLATLAAIGGHAPAGGCMLALSCDFRIMSSSCGGTIGLNESKLGIVAPPWLGKQYMDILGHRPAELHLSLGTLFGPQEALDLGLIDEVVTTDDVVTEAQQRAKAWVRIPPQARKGVKDMTRGIQIQQLLDMREQDTEHFCNFVTQQKVQASLGMYLEQMAKRKK